MSFIALWNQVFLLRLDNLLLVVMADSFWFSPNIVGLFTQGISFLLLNLFLAFVGLKFFKFSFKSGSSRRIIFLVITDLALL